MSLAVFDACVLYPPSLRDLLMWLAVAKVYEPRWSEEIHEEWMRNVLKDNPEIRREQLERTRTLMNGITSRSLVSGYRVHLASLTLPDAKDCHVVAVALEAKASLIVTFNLKDFPGRVLSPLGIRALHPDAFLESLFLQNGPRFLLGIRQHRASLKNPPKTTTDYLATMTSLGLKKMALRLEVFQEEF